MQWMVLDSALEVEVSVGVVEAEAEAEVGVRVEAEAEVLASHCLLTETRIDTCRGHPLLLAQATTPEAAAYPLIGWRLTLQ
jgi:hypothetical protein